MLEPNLYRLRVSASPGWVDYRACTLGISVGQPYHEGEKFAATVEWAARHFEEIVVDVSDTLQRHRLIGGGVPAAAAGAGRRQCLRPGRPGPPGLSGRLGRSGRPPRPGSQFPWAVILVCRPGAAMVS